jgi:hypothetical protein
VRAPSGVLAWRGLGVGACDKEPTLGSSEGSRADATEKASKQARTGTDQAGLHAACGREFTGGEAKVVLVTPNVGAKRTTTV